MTSLNDSHHGHLIKKMKKLVITFIEYLLSIRKGKINIKTFGKKSKNLTWMIMWNILLYLYFF